MLTKRIVFMGTPDFATPILNHLIKSPYEVVLVVTQPDRPKGRKKTLSPPPVKVEAEKHQIPVFQPEKISENYEVIFNYEPDIIVTAAYGQILPEALLNWPEFGCINVHASLLPQLRGGAPIHYAILQGKKETGITIMYMVKKLDAGDMLAQRKIPIEDDDHVGSLHDKLAKLGADLLIETLPKLFSKSITPIEQKDEEATFAPNITRAIEKIDWSKSHNHVYNHIRGLHPWPVAFTTYKGKTMKIWWAKRDERLWDGDPGEIVEVNDDFFVVACGNQKGLKITEIQPAGNRRMLVSDYLKGNKDKIRSGIILGDDAEKNYYVK